MIIAKKLSFSRVFSEKFLFYHNHGILNESIFGVHFGRSEKKRTSADFLKQNESIDFFVLTSLRKGENCNEQKRMALFRIVWVIF